MLVFCDLGWVEVKRVGFVDTVALDGEVEQEIVWLFSRIGGGCAVELPEEVIIKELNGRFAAWKVCDGLSRLREQGVTASASRVHTAFVRRCWQVVPGCWSRIRLPDVTTLSAVT